MVMELLQATAGRHRSKQAGAVGGLYAGCPLPGDRGLQSECAKLLFREQAQAMLELEAAEIGHALLMGGFLTIVREKVRVSIVPVDLQAWMLATSAR